VARAKTSPPSPPRPPPRPDVHPSHSRSGSDARAIVMPSSTSANGAWACEVDSGSLPGALHAQRARPGAAWQR
jgi:hypothetical protein